MFCAEGYELDALSLKDHSHFSSAAFLVAPLPAVISESLVSVEENQNV